MDCWTLNIICQRYKRKLVFFTKFKNNGGVVEELQIDYGGTIAFIIMATLKNTVCTSIYYCYHCRLHLHVFTHVYVYL